MIALQRGEFRNSPPGASVLLAGEEHAKEATRGDVAVYELVVTGMVLKGGGGLRAIGFSVDGSEAV